MRLLGITDLHDNRAALERILAHAGPVDLILLGGDLTDFGQSKDAEQIVRRAQQSGAQVLAVAGNCDSAAIERRLVELGVSLFRQGVVLHGVGLQGLSAMPPWRGDMYQFTENELAQALEAGYQQIAGAGQHVVLSHPPPHATHVDRTFHGQNVGSTALREFIERVQPVLVLCGHIHEGRGTESIGRTLVVNCGAASAGSYALVEIGTTLAVELREA
jgi:Icc-related predicted phosphoesterase